MSVAVFSIRELGEPCPYWSDSAHIVVDSMCRCGRRVAVLIYQPGSVATTDDLLANSDRVLASAIAFNDALSAEQAMTGVSLADLSRPL